MTRSIYRQDFKSPVPAQGVIFLQDTQEHGVDKRPLHVCNLMEKLILEDGGPCILYNM